jgi:DNA polymerase-3 subunit delta
MATKTSTAEKKQIYVYHGADDTQKRAAVERLVSELVEPDFRDFDFETLYGPDVTADRLIMAAGVAPFASKKRLVVVSQANDIPNSEQQAIAAKLDRVSESACVVLVTPAPEIKDGKPKSGSDLHKDLSAAIRKVGKSVDFPLMRDMEATGLVKRLLSDLGKSITPSAAAAIVRRCGTDSGVLATEAAKLSSYVGDRGSVTDADVEQVTTQTVEEKIFALMDAVGSKRPALALELLHPLLHGGGGNVQGEALRTLTMLARHFRQIWQARVLMDAGCKAIVPGGVPDYMAAILPSDNILKIKDWQLAKFVAQAKNFTVKDLIRCFEKIASVDLAIKGIEGKVTDPALALELLVVELSTGRQDGKRGRH